MGRKLYVGNLPYDTADADLQHLFGQAGAVESVTVIQDKETGRSRGFAFVEMATEADAQRAIADLHEHELGGRRLTVNEARPREFAGAGQGGDSRRPRHNERW